MESHKLMALWISPLALQRMICCYYVGWGLLQYVKPFKLCGLCVPGGQLVGFDLTGRPSQYIVVRSSIPRIYGVSGSIVDRH